MVVLFNRKSLSALRSGHHQIFRNDSSSKRAYICSIQRTLKCARHEFKLYLFTEVQYILYIYIYIYTNSIYCHTSHFSKEFPLCVKTLRSANPWMNFPKWNKLQLIFPAQRVESDGQRCVGSMSVGTQFMHVALLTSWLSESGVN